MSSSASPARLLGIVLAVLTMTAACASNPARLPVVDPGEAKGSDETVFIATTRTPSDDPAVRFGPGRGGDLYFAEAGVWVPHNRVPGSVNLPSRRVDPAREFALTRFETHADGSDQVGRISAFPVSASTMPGPRPDACRPIFMTATAHSLRVTG
jgi:esterase/lipase superfamily enzyme